MIRLLKGPDLSDRIIAFDVISVMAVSLLVLLSIYFKRSIYLDVALVFGLIGFLGTTIFGRYIERGI
ncbi:Na(+) H(+) antiporter subunit F [hydrothermal vent metagenome]|uniref:Na(+) H(+) antiporter subunit F n=1 Tax=hydrothermal vent metagenome TaxID=652676 RepID=A0A1W1C6K3_9ZZZZ